MVDPVIMNGVAIAQSSKATHVGIVRSPEGNNFALADRISSHRRAIFGLMHSGLARSHRGNPYASLRVESCFGVSVLLSGLSAVVLTQKEENSLAQHYKVHVERLLRLHQSTPHSMVFLVAGCLPLPGLLHLRIFSLFGQLCRLRSGNNILARHASTILISILLLMVLES